ncbi:hypothetical protein ETD86_45590 [Nonomuraea turkmeniaca]|uniref:DUF1795 domain-containing protein n=1 Tax=Nonomuraea turkmeniaca TaxID=103838 RepID=A0A5S4EZ86_9ACTN|nr:hypothetical protein [Nonomuraea turkmeniaca]TMR08950.1 hypothetical protein ETD86_45590 [Nonomuraea turkmeniaca]
MTVTVPWPNEASPGLRPFQISVPGGWTAIEPPGALIAFLGPERAGFRPNVVVFGERLPEDLPLGDVAEQVLLDLGADSILRPVAPDDPVAIREATVTVEGRGCRHLVLVAGQPDLSAGGLRTVHILLGTQLAGAPDVLPDIFSSFSCE